MPRPKTKAAAYTRLMLRLPAEMMAVIKAQADALERPYNTHVVRLLRLGLGCEHTPADGEVTRELVGQTEG